MRTLLKNARILDSERRVQAVNVLIENRVIADVYTGDREFSLLEAIDLEGKFLLPGLINTHVHLFGYPDGFSTERLRKWIGAGFTTLRDEGIHSRHTSADAVRFRDECAKDPTLPSLRVCGQVISGPNGYSELNSLCVESTAEARDIVQQQYDAGVDHLKVSLQDGNNSVVSRQPKLENSLIAELCNEAHRFGMKVSGQFIHERNLKRMLGTGLDDISHIWTPETPDDVMQRVIDEGISIVPTLTNYAEFTSRIHYDILSYAEMNVKTFVDMGGNIAFGDNFIQPLEPWFHVGMPMMEIGLMIKAGMTMYQIIDSMTVGAAKLLGLADHGRIEPGYVADLIALCGNPYEIPQLLTTVPFVMKQGILVKHHDMRQYATYF